MGSVGAMILIGLLAYLAGSIPFGLLIGKYAAGIDIRSQGSRNIGATNVARLLGPRWGLLALVLDALKGAIPVWLLPRLALLLTGDGTAASASESEFLLGHARVLCAVMTIVGHMFPCWLGFRGGKGVATALGVVVVLAWQGTLASLVTFLLVFLIRRLVSLASIAAVLGFAVAEIWLLWPEPFSASHWSLATFSIAVPLLIVFRHRGNIVRILNGTEPRFGSKPTVKSSSEGE